MLRGAKAHVEYAQKAVEILKELLEGTSANDFRLESIIPVDMGLEIGVSYRMKEAEGMALFFENVSERTTKYVTLDENKEFVSLRNEYSNE